jgi:hypothetical protein
MSTWWNSYHIGYHYVTTVGEGDGGESILNGSLVAVIDGSVGFRLLVGSARFTVLPLKSSPAASTAICVQLTDPRMPIEAHFTRGSR